MNSLKIFVIVFASFLATTGFAQWSSDPSVNNAICTFANQQETPVLCSDGDNGAIIVWWDHRTDAGDIYAQRIDKNGIVQWSSNGVPICVIQNKQSAPSIISDDKGGAIITWDDERTGTYSGNIYAQRINSIGQVQWLANGSPVKVGAAYTPKIVTDNASGAIIAWRDDRVSTDAADVYAQRIDSSGNILWTPSTGIAVVTTASQQFPSCIISDDSGGAIIIWTHVRADGTRNLFAQRINASGSKIWTSAGVTIVNLATSSQAPTAQPDKQGGFYVLWNDSRGSSGNRKIYGQHFNSSGVSQWNANGNRLTTETLDLDGPANFIVDGSNGLIFGYSQSISYYDKTIFAQRVGNDGTVLWDTLSIPICARKWARERPEIISDASGGAILCWFDDRTPESEPYPLSLYDIYAQRIDLSGNILWEVNGVPVSNAANGQSIPKILTVDGGSAIIVWDDYRNNNHDIYAQKIYSNGTVTNVQTPELIPDEFVLYQNYPNPFNPSTMISYQLPVSSNVTLKVFDVLGNEIATLVNEEKPAGSYEVEFQSAVHSLPTGQAGHQFASGIYYYQLRAGDYLETKKMILIK